MTEKQRIIDALSVLDQAMPEVFKRIASLVCPHRVGLKNMRKGKCDEYLGLDICVDCWHAAMEAAKE